MNVSTSNVEDNPNVGMFWHCHHDELIEWCYSYKKRVAFIRSNKDAHEIDTRLQLFKKVTSALPDEIIDAGRAFDQAWRVYVEANRVYDKERLGYEVAEWSYLKAERALNRARRVQYEIWRSLETIIKRNMSAIMALHDVECPNCPWDGHTIFPELEAM
jgi:hypothetical protein